MFVEKINEEITLIGTSHISEESADMVKNVIMGENPDCVGVELCEKRFTALRDKKKWENMSIPKVVREGKTYLLLTNIILSNYQKKLGDEVGITPGSEMLNAVELAERLGKEITLIDRDIQTTFKRSWDSMPLKEKIKFIFYIFSGFFEEVDEEAIESLKDKDVLNELLQEISERIPHLKKALIDERDEYIALKILEKYREGKKIVAVIGAGHLAGVKRIIEEHSIRDALIPTRTTELEEVARGRSKAKILAYMIPILFVVLVVYGFYTRGIEFTVTILIAWVIINGTLSALGVILAMGHPLSVLAALIAAPITSLNPALAAGWVAGLVEVKMRTPKVKDFKELSHLERMRDYWKNNVTRVLLVVAFANIGSMIGTFIALPYLLSLF